MARHGEIIINPWIGGPEQRPDMGEVRIDHYALPSTRLTPEICQTIVDIYMASAYAGTQRELDHHNHISAGLLASEIDEGYYAEGWRFGSRYSGHSKLGVKKEGLKLISFWFDANLIPDELGDPNSELSRAVAETSSTFSTRVDEHLQSEGVAVPITQFGPIVTKGLYGPKGPTRPGAHHRIASLFGRNRQSR